MSAAADVWLRERLAQVPEELVEWMIERPRTGEPPEEEEVDQPEAGPPGGNDPIVDDLGKRGSTELRAATRVPGRNRETAFRLLVADAFITYATEAAAEASDPEAALDDLLRTIVGDVPTGPDGS